MSRLLLNIIIFFALVLNASSALATAKLHYEINGIGGEILTNVKKRFDAKLAPLQPSLDKNKIESFYQQAENEIRLGMAPYGYFQPKVHATLTANGNEHWTLQISVNSGPKIRVTSLHLSIQGAGKNDPEFIKLQCNFPIKQGAEFTTESYDNAKSMLLNLGQQRGYFDAKLTENRVVINQQPYGAAITLSFNTGQRYRFGAVHFTNTEALGKQLSDKFLQRFVPFKEGDEYDNDLINKLQLNLSSSGDFIAVVVTPQTEHPIGKKVPINVTLTPGKSQLYNFGVGYGTDNGVRARTNIKLRRLTSSGHYLSMDAKGSGQENELNTTAQLSYNIPGRDPTTDLYKFGVEGEVNNDEETGTNENVKGNASYTTEISGWQQTGGLTLLLERSKPNDEIADTTTFLIPNINWLRIKSDDLILPNNGYRISLSLRGASRSTLGSTDFFQAYLQTKWLHSFTDSFRVILRGDIGTLLVEDTEDIPLSLRFFAGGASSVRGYKYKWIGNNISGHDIAVGSIELQHRIYKQLYICAFFDAGNVSSSFFDNYYRGVGGGLVYRSPIGSFSLTLGNALDIEGKPSLLQFNMGAEL